MSSGVIYFRVPGSPMAKRSQKVITRRMGDRAFSSIVSTDTVVQAEAYFVSFARQHKPEVAIQGAIAMRIACVFPLVGAVSSGWKRAAALVHRIFPKSKRRDDADNLAKLVMDAMQRAGYWEDDGQVVDLHITKRYGVEPGTEVWVWSLPECTSAKAWKEEGGGKAET